jgi:hypothetical protein
MNQKLLKIPEDMTLTFTNLKKLLEGRKPDKILMSNTQLERYKSLLIDYPKKVSEPCSFMGILIEIKSNAKE